MKRDPDKSDFCYFPFMEMLLTAEGKYKPCSKHEEFVYDKGKVLQAVDSSAQDAWNSEYMVGLRESFLKGERRKGCRECWREQDMGLKPMRYDSYNYGITEDQVQNPKQPLRIEINASNICNLKCRICMPTASHKWIREAKELYGWDEKVHFNMTDENVEIIQSWAENFVEIAFFGGEPLMAKENLELLQYCVDKGFAKNINVLLNTNGTVYSDEIVALFKKFKHVYLNFSIDDIGERFEYQRKNAKWPQVVENIKKYVAHGGYTQKDVIQSKLCCSVTNMNIYYFPEFFEFMNKNFPGMPVYWNLIYEPWEYSIEIIPNEVKDIIRERLKKYVKTTYKMTRQGTKTVEDLIIFLDNSIDKDFQGFFERTERHDKFRKESFADVFPEYWELIKDYRKEPVLGETKPSKVEALPVVDDNRDFKELFISNIEKFEDWDGIKGKVDELEKMVVEIESAQTMYKVFYEAPEAIFIETCKSNSVDRLFEMYKDRK